MNFFFTKKHVDEWLDHTPHKNNDIYVLDIENANMMAKAIFGK